MINANFEFPNNAANVAWSFFMSMLTEKIELAPCNDEDEERFRLLLVDGIVEVRFELVQVNAINALLLVALLQQTAFSCSLIGINFHFAPKESKKLNIPSHTRATLKVISVLKSAQTLIG